ncbi:MAG: hypothetical protein DRQ78_08360, partial [Epsilonproteobacteria bacterium]
MIKVSLSRDEIEEALMAYADKMFSSQMLVNNDIKITQGKSASATVVLVPKGATKEEAAKAISEAEKDIETIAGQPEPQGIPAATV